MARAPATPAWQIPLVLPSTTVVGIVVIGALYIGAG